MVNRRFIKILRDGMVVIETCSKHVYVYVHNYSIILWVINVPTVGEIEKMR